MPGIYTLRNLQDVDRIKARVDEGIKQAVVVGAGFIGLELVENFLRRGVQVTLVELQDQVMPPLDKEMNHAESSRRCNLAVSTSCSVNRPRL